MSEQPLIGAYINPQDAACGQSLDITHDEYCSTEMSSVEHYHRAQHVAAGQTCVCGMSDHRLHVKLRSALLHASIGGRSVIFGHWFGNLDAILKSCLARVLKHQLILLFLFASTHLLPHAKRSHENTQKSSTTNNQYCLSRSMMVCVRERPLRERRRSVVVNRCRTPRPASVTLC